MNISKQVLERYLDTLPKNSNDLRHLLDDVGIEVKRMDEQGVIGVELLANRGDH